jgi:hypothetical protein
MQLGNVERSKASKEIIFSYMHGNKRLKAQAREAIIIRYITLEMLKLRQEVVWKI